MQWEGRIMDCAIGYIFDADGQKIADFWCKNNYEAQKKIDNYIKSNNLDEKKFTH